MTTEAEGIRITLKLDGRKSAEALVERIPAIGERFRFQFEGEAWAEGVCDGLTERGGVTTAVHAKLV